MVTHINIFSNCFQYENIVLYIFKIHIINIKNKSFEVHLYIHYISSHLLHFQLVGL